MSRLDPTDEDYAWMTEFALKLITQGKNEEDAITIALREGECRARNRKQRERTEQAAKAHQAKNRPTLTTSLGDLLKQKSSSKKP
jgi:hypothetical protein